MNTAAVAIVVGSVPGTVFALAFIADLLLGQYRLAPPELIVRFSIAVFVLGAVSIVATPITIGIAWIRRRKLQGVGGAVALGFAGFSAAGWVLFLLAYWAPLYRG